MRKITLILAIMAMAGQVCAATIETWVVDGKTFDSKAQAIRYVVASGKRLEVAHTRCEILTNKLTFKACPKNRKGSWENEQFSGPVSKTAGE